MLNADYGEGDNLSANAGRFSEIITGYDKNGNIEGLKRSGKSSSTTYGMIDNLTLTYDGNQLKNVTDAATDPLYNGVFNFVDENKGSGTEYLYDSNGNMQQDYNKKISKIQYTLLYLPTTLQFTNGNRKDYTYSADGKKLKVVHKTAIANISVPMGQIKELAASQVSQTHTVDYCGNVIYENGSLSKVLTEEGYATLDGTIPTFYYYLRDHQGNNQMVVRLNGTSWNTEQMNHYYPFGGVFEVNTETSGKQPYKYNGKELDRMHGLDWYDYGARMMDAALGRWHVVDPLAEKYYSTSPYTYCLNSPVKYVDPDGRIVGTALGGIIGGIAGGYRAYKEGKSFWAGAAEGAVSGAITGAAVDLAVGSAVATGGGSLLVLGVGAAAGTIGGAGGAIVGDVVGQVVDQRSNNNIKISTENFSSKAINGAIAGAVGGVASGVASNLGKMVATSSKSIQQTMSNNINSTATVLGEMGASAKTTSVIVNQITKGMSEVGKTTANSIWKIDAGTSTITEFSLKITEDKWKK